MVGTLKIISEAALHDFEKKGYYKNIALGCPLASNNQLIPWWFFVETDGRSPAVTFSLERIDLSLNVQDSYSLTNSWVDLAYEDSVLYYMYDASEDILGYIEDTLGETYEDGYYRYKIVLADFGTYYSEIFRINDFSKISVISGGGDFSSDFGGDFDVFSGAPV